MSFNIQQVSLLFAEKLPQTQGSIVIPIYPTHTNTQTHSKRECYCSMWSSINYYAAIHFCGPIVVCGNWNWWQYIIDDCVFFFSLLVEFLNSVLSMQQHKSRTFRHFLHDNNLTIPWFLFPQKVIYAAAVYVAFLMLTTTDPWWNLMNI